MNPSLWLAWFCFGTFLVWLLGRRYYPLLRETAALPEETKRPGSMPAKPAWLFCEEGAALDRRVQWFGLRPGGRTVVGARPRAATDAATFIYLTADDIREDHAAIDFNPSSGRYEVETLDGGQV